MSDGRSGVAWSSGGNFRFAVVVVYFGKNASVHVQFVLFPDMLLTGDQYLITGAYKSATDNHLVRIGYTSSGVKLHEWYYNSTNIVGTDLCPLHVYEWF